MEGYLIISTYFQSMRVGLGMVCILESRGNQLSHRHGKDECVLQDHELTGGCAKQATIAVILITPHRLGKGITSPP